MPKPIGTLDGVMPILSFYEFDIARETRQERIAQTEERDGHQICPTCDNGLQPCTVRHHVLEIKQVPHSGLLDKYIVDHYDEHWLYCPACDQAPPGGNLIATAGSYFDRPH